MTTEHAVLNIALFLITVSLACGVACAIIIRRRERRAWSRIAGAIEGFEVDFDKDPATQECFAKGCSEIRNPGHCLFCRIHHPECYADFFPSEEARR